MLRSEWQKSSDPGDEQESSSGVAPGRLNGIFYAFSQSIAEKGDGLLPVNDK